jgi:hypothetical protein
LTAILLFFTASPGLATRARIDTFNGLHDFIRDEENISLYPSMITEHANLIVVNLGRVTGTGQDLKFPISYRSAGGTVSLGSGHRYGVAGGFLAQESFPDTVSYLQGTTSSDPFYNLLRGWESDDRPEELGHRFDMIYGYPLNSSWTIGVRLHRGLFSTRTTNSVDSLDNSWWTSVTLDGEKRLDMLEVTGGLTYRPGDRTALYLAAGPRWHDYLLRIETPDESDRFRDAGNISYAMRFKLERKLGNGIDLLGHLRYEKIDISGVGFQSGVGDYYRERIQKTVGAGLGLRYYREGIFDLTAGFLISRKRLDDRTEFDEPTQVAPSEWKNLESTRIVLPQFFAAFEVNLQKWLILRFGVAQAVSDVEESTEEQLGDTVVREVQEEAENPIRTNIGTRFLYKSLFVDFWLHSSAPYSPSAFIAGTGLTNPVMEVSAGYRF